MPIVTVEPVARACAPDRSRPTASRTTRSTPTGCRSWPPGARGRSSWRLPERVCARLRGNPVDNDLRKWPRTSKLVDNRARQPRSQPVTYVLPEGATRTKATIRVLASGLEAAGSAVPSGVLLCPGPCRSPLGPAAETAAAGAGPRREANIPPAGTTASSSLQIGSAMRTDRGNPVDNPRETGLATCKVVDKPTSQGRPPARIVGLARRGHEHLVIRLVLALAGATSDRGSFGRFVVPGSVLGGYFRLGSRSVTSIELYGRAHVAA